MANKLVCCYVLMLIAPVIVQSISVIGPRVLRPHSSYRVGVAPGARPTSLYVAVEGRRFNGEQFSQGREVQSLPGSSRIVELEIGDPGPGDYSLIARSTSGPQFSASSSLVYQARSFCVFVQTDKRVYQPGETISFRVIALDRYLLPLTGTVDVNVLDAGGTPVRQWASIPLDRGLLSAELVLADEPSLGEWTVQVETRGQVYSRRVLVADYVMPKFQLELNVPDQVLFSEGRFIVNVTARHFNGLPVRGELTLSAYAVFFSGVLQPVFSSPARKVVNIDGQTAVTYDLKTDLDLAEDAARPLVLEAVLEEKDTLIRQNVSTRILLVRTPYRLRVTAPEHFKPTLPYNIQIEVVDISGTLMQSSVGDVMVERLWDDGAPPNVTRVTLNGGVAVYNFIPDVPHTNSTLNVLIKYMDVKERVVNVRRSQPADGQYLSLQILTKNVTTGDQLRAKILATEPLDLLHYAVIGRGDILIVNTIELSPARRTVDIKVQVTSSMAPGCILLAWYPRLDPINNSILATSIYVPVGPLLQHEISISASPAGGRPGGSVELRVTGAPGSHAALLAGDSRASKAGLAENNGLGSGLSMLMIEREVESFSGLKHSVFNNNDRQPSLGTDLSGNTTADVFQNSGIVILTDGVIQSGTTAVAETILPTPETGTRPPLAGPYAFSRLPPPPAPRYYLPLTPHPTWLLANFSIGQAGDGGVSRRTPTWSSEWSVGAFAVHPTLGLGLAKAGSLLTSSPLTLRAELPETLQRGETLAAILIATSTLSVDSELEVTFHNSEQYFEFEPLENDVDSAKKIELFRRQRVKVPARGSASTAFLITAVKGGEAPIIAEASGNGVSASLFRTIDIKDGDQEELWTWSLLDGRRGVARANISLHPTLGTRVGPASLRATGDLIAPALNAFRTPSIPAADPAYALRPLALACVLLDYLEDMQRDEVALTAEAHNLAAAGYQRLVAYRRSDGSFSSELNLDEGDVWMTAMSARWLNRCSKRVTVSPEAAKTSARWLASAQSSDGSWPSPPPLQRHNQRAQTTLSLTAHALLSLQEVQSAGLYNNEINKATDYLARGLSDQLDAHTLALLARALSAVRHPQASLALQMLDLHANITENSRFWQRGLSGNEWRNPWLRGNSADVGTAALGLQALLAARLTDEAIPVARYILSAYSPNRVDPDVLDAIAELAVALKTSTKMRVSATTTGSEDSRQFNIDDDNALLLQTQLIRSIRNISVVTEGRGIALVGLSATGSTNVTAAWPRYTLDPRVDAVSTSSRLQLSICTGFVPQRNETISGFTLLTVYLPSGYKADLDTLTSLKASSHVATARLAADGTRVLAWLRPLDTRERCATLAAPRVAPIARQRPGYATLVDLYDSSRRARVFFQPIISHACDICRVWPSCESACGAASRQRAEDLPKTPSSPGAAGQALPMNITITIIIFIWTLCN